MRQVLLITAKDLRLGLRDRSMLLMALVVPFTLATIFSFVFGDTGGAELDVALLAVDEDGGALGNQLVEGVLGDVVDAGAGITFEQVADRAAAVDRVEAGDADAVLIVPEGFTEAVTAGRRTSIEVVANVDASIGRQVATGIADRFAQELTGTQLAVASVLAAAGGDAPPPDEIAAAARSAGSPVSVVDGAVAANQLDATTYLAGGMAVFFLFFTVQYGVLGMLEERRDGTLARLYSSPMPRRAVLVSKTLTSFVLGVVSLVVLMVASGLLLGAEWGDPAGLALLILAGVGSAVSTVLLVGTLARTAEQAATWQSIIAVVLGLAGGVFFDVSRGSPLLARLALLTPHQWFMRGLGELAGGGGPRDVLPQVGGMLLFGVVVLVASVAVGRVAGRRTL